MIFNWDFTGISQQIPCQKNTKDFLRSSKEREHIDSFKLKSPGSRRTSDGNRGLQKEASIPHSGILHFQRDPSSGRLLGFDSPKSSARNLLPSIQEDPELQCSTAPLLWDP